MLEIVVTGKHIGKGEACNARICPVALALAEATGRVWHADYDTLFDLTTGKEYRTPDGVWQWMYAFDRGREVYPFAFALEGVDDA